MCHSHARSLRIETCAVLNLQYGFVSFPFLRPTATYGEPNMSHDHDDADLNSSGNQEFQTVLTKRLSRRELFGGAASAAALAAVGATATDTASAHGANAGYGGGYGGSRHRLLKLNFDPVAKNLEDAVTLPQGYSYDVLYALGDPIAGHVSDYANDGSDNPATYVFRSGDHHDGMYFF